MKIDGPLATLKSAGTPCAMEMARDIITARKFLYRAVDFPESVLHASTDYGRDLLRYGAFVMPFDNVLIKNVGYLQDREGQPSTEHMVAWLSVVKQPSGYVVRTIEESGDYHWYIPFGVLVEEPSSIVRQGKYLYNVDEDEPYLLHMVAKHGGSYEENRQRMSVNVSQSVGAVVSFVGLISTRGLLIEEHVPAAKVNARRESAGKPRIYAHSTIKIDIKALRIPGLRSADNLRSSPHIHPRRGHVRQLADGKLVKVRPTIVGLNNMQPGEKIPARDYEVAR